jgi:hypothetical protein
VAAREVTPAPSRRFDWPGPIRRPDTAATPGQQPTHRQHGASIDALIDAHASHRVVNRFTIDDETLAQTVPGPPPWVRGNGASTRVAAQSAAG